MLLAPIGLRGVAGARLSRTGWRIGRRVMPGFARFLLRAAVAAGLLLTGGTSALLAQQRVGVNSAVNPEATGAQPGAQPRRLVIGQDVIFNEHITTGAAGQTQLLFLDESSMSIGPNSDLTIDQFVYDPKTGTGKLAMSATRGALALCRRQAEQAERRCDAAHCHGDIGRAWRRVHRADPTRRPAERHVSLRQRLDGHRLDRPVADV